MFDNLHYIGGNDCVERKKTDLWQINRNLYEGLRGTGR